jgi:signal transduction histidine kinase
MPDGGELRVRTGLMEVGAGTGQQAASASGDHAGARIYVELADSGCGMNEETRSRIFDPFYTTKAAGHGGLGLVVVRQVVREHGGQIQVESAEGRGARFLIELPAVARPASDTRGEVLVEA